MNKLLYIFLLAPIFCFSQVKYKGGKLLYNGSEVQTNGGVSYTPPIASAPVANFTASSTSINEGATVNFTDTSTNTPTSWAWTFTGGAPSTSTAQNPSISYATAGTYDVGLTATNTEGSNLVTKSGYITVATATPSDSTFTAVNPTFTAPAISTTYTPTSSADLSNAANANKIAIITNSFDATGVTLASGQIIRPNGGAISGTNINLSDAYIENNYLRAFSSSVTFTSLYDKSRISPETFGAIPDDAIDDITPITTWIEQNAYGITQNLKEYIINTDRQAGQFNPITRAGIFDWNMNGAVVKTTNNSTFRHTAGEITMQGYYLLPFGGFDLVSIYGGSFNGQNLASRIIDIYNCKQFNFDNLVIENLESPANSYARAIALNFKLNPTTGGFEKGFITNNTIQNINAIGDGISNNSVGISKGLSFSMTENGLAEVWIKGNTVENIIGDDAEGLYTRGDSNYLSDVALSTFYIKQNSFINNRRRAVKFDASNMILEDNIITTNSTAYTGNQAALIQFFSIQAGRPVKNAQIRRNTVTINGSSLNSFFGTNDSRDITIDNNTFNSGVFTVNRTLSFSNTTGQQDELYDGDLSNLIFTNNTITNGIIDILDKYYVLSGLSEPIFENNTQTFSGSISLGAYRGAINIGGSSLSGTMKNTHDFRIKNHTINYDLNTMSSGVFNGVFSSNGVKPKRVILDNVTINYTGSGSVGANFAGVRSGSTVDYDNTNQILNCTITGKSGTGALKFNGADLSVVITNSFGDGSTNISF